MILTEVDFTEKIRVVDNFPKEGISYKDITPILMDKDNFKATLDILSGYYSDIGITKVCGIESRGFIFGSAIADRIGAGFIPIRKQGKLPYVTTKVKYDLEYGTDIIEIHNDSICSDDIVLIHDDLLATGGTLNASLELVRRFNPKQIFLSVIIELKNLNGRKYFANEDLKSLVRL